MKVYILFGSDDYTTRQILDVFDNREAAEAAIKANREARTLNEMRYKLISRQGEPIYTISEREVVSK